LISQQLQDGRWSAQPEQPADCLASVWAILALQSGHYAGLPVPESAVRDAVALLHKNQVRLRGPEPRRADSERACVAGELVCQAIFGKLREPRDQQRVADVLAEGPVAGDVQFNFFATALAADIGGPVGASWTSKLDAHLARSQVQQSAAQGSWHSPESSVNAWGGRLGETALVALTVIKLTHRRLSWRQQHQAVGDEF
jgi:hypothetical protein